MSEIPLRMLRARGRGDASVGRADATRSVSGKIMVPRTLYIASVTALALFGLLMIYSASSIVGLTSEAYNNDPTYFLIKQVKAMAVGLVFAFALAYIDYRAWTGIALKVAWGITLFSLFLIYTPMAGQDAYGATRWINLFGFSFQPSEFAKITIVLTGAHLAALAFEEHCLDLKEGFILAGVGVVLPIILVVAQPDKGTTGVLAATLVVMLYLAGLPGKWIVAIGASILVIAMVYAYSDSYSRARILTMIDPFRDQYGAGYQVVQGFYAFGSGGLTGVGLGMSRQKYNYLPMAHNDFIFAVVGEELGVLGTVGLLAAFAVMLWAGLKIAENAPDLAGRLIAAGCTTLLVIQMLLNVCGVVGIFPLSGKPIPFISYGGSSIISSLMLAGLVVSVSLRSTVPETSYDERRSKLRIASDHPATEMWGDSYNGHIEGSTAGRVRARTSRSFEALGSATGSASARRDSFRVVEGGSSRNAKPAGRVTVDKNGRRRIDLGPSPSERLRDRREKR